MTRKVRNVLEMNASRRFVPGSAAIGAGGLLASAARAEPFAAKPGDGGTTLRAMALPQAIS